MPGVPPEALRWRRVLGYAAAFFSLMIAGGALFVWSGIYNVAASTDHWFITTWILERVRTESVDTWSSFVGPPPPLDDIDRVKVGAAHFEGGCTPCHSRPGDSANAIATAMLPPPPPLGEAVRDLATNEIFWIVKHGLKFTAMPAWPSQQRDDEVWAVAAFLEQLPKVSREEYRELAGVAPGEGETSGAELAASSESVGLTECVRCHGDAAKPPHSAFIPLLNGQPRQYLERALEEYAAAARPSGIMQPVSGLLDPGERRRIVAWYAGLAAPPMRRTGAQGDAARGRRLAQAGDPEKGIPPCLACHAQGHPRSFPSLAGQNAAYLVTQLQLLKSGERNRTVHGQIMTVIAARLDRQQIEDAAAWFAALPPGGAPSFPEAAR